MIESRDIAIVGYACRFPGGADSPDAFWKLMSEARDAVTEIPHDRWEPARFAHPDEPGKAYTFAAGTLGDVSGFDAEFFGVSPREAEQMDPQQRLLLELAWEALEHGGLVPERLAGSDAAVFVGISATDYGNIRQDDASSGNAYFMLGSTLSIAANRMSFVFDFKGPSMAIDTACSSSLVALSEAWQAVRSGRTSLALVGGVNLLLSPYAFVGFSKASMLAPYGRCRAFDKLAEGYVRAEGGGMVVLKPLADALRDGDPIRAVIRAAAANADGHTSGIALPSAEMQAGLLTGLYGPGGIDPEDVAYFEAHGTGTRVGDPIEAAAIGRAVAARRTAPLPIGSVKSNIGHLEPASGMAGLIKALLVLAHREIPPTLHVDTPNPDIDFAGLNIEIARRPMPLPKTSGAAVVGVNSFGFGGTNAHVAIAEYHSAAPAPTAAPIADAPLLLSARGDTALKARAAQVAAFLGESPAAWEDLAATFARRREHLERRVAVSGPGPVANRQLAAFAAGDGGATISGKALPVRQRKVAFVFAGNGSQYPGMGAALFAEDEVFRDAFTRIDSALAKVVGWSLVEEMLNAAESSRFADATVAQPLLFALQVGLTESLKARGLVPDTVIGHSVGEAAAAYCAGCLDLDSAIRLIAARSSVLGKIKGKGRMAGVMLGPERAAEVIAPYGSAIEIAAINSGRAVTLTGEEAPLKALGASLKGIDFRLLELDYPFHSHILDPLKDELAQRLVGLVPQPGNTQVISTVTGAVVVGADLDIGYWWRNLRCTVRFREAIAAAVDSGHGIFVEIGAQPILQAYIRHTLGESHRPAVAQGVLTRNQAGLSRVRAAALRAWTVGANLDLDRLYARRHAVVDLPGYPWQRKRFWFPVTPEARGALIERSEGPLLGFRPVTDAPLWEAVVDTKVLPVFAGHVVGGAALFPATGFVEIAVEAARRIFGEGAADIENFEIHRPLVLDRARVVRTTWVPGEARLTIESRTRMTDEPWQVHVTARLAAPVVVAPGVAPPPLVGDVVNAGDHYAVAAALGLDYSGAFRSVRAVTVAVGAAEAILALDGDAGDFRLHPALFDGGLQALFDVLARAGAEATTYLPQRIGRFLLHAEGVPARCRVALTRRGARSLVADFTLIDAAGTILAEAKGFRFLRAEFGRARSHDLLHREALVALPPLAGDDAVPEAALAVARGALTAVPRPIFAADLDRLAAVFARRALAEFGHGPESDMLDVALDAEVGADAVPFIAAVLAMAEADAPDDAEAAWRDLLGRHPEGLAEIGLTGLAGLRLATRIRATAEVPPPATALRDQLAAASPTVVPALDALAAAVAAVAATWPAARRLQVLEVNAGSGALSRRLAAALPGCDLTLADADEVALAGLREDVPEAAVVRFDPARPEFEGRFDVIVGVGLLTLAPEAADALRAVAAPGATLLLADLAPAPWLDLVFGADPTWWHPAATGDWLPATPDAARMLAAVAGWSDATTVPIGGMTVVSARAETASKIPAASGIWKLIAADVDAVRPLAAALGARGVVAEVLSEFAAHDPAAWAELWRAQPTGAVWLPAAAPANADTAAMLAVQQAAAWPVLAAAQGALAAELDERPCLAVVTDAGVDGAAVWGVGRVLANEVPELAIKRVGGSDAVRIAAELLADDGEDEVVATAGGRLGVRVVPACLDAPADGDATRLAFTPGSLDRLTWAAATRRAPGAGEVEIAVRATGLNFRDLMFALGLLPEEAVENGFAGATVGMEAAGEIVRVGDGVADLEVGQKVLFFAPACFASHVTTRTTAVAPLPEGLSFAEGATIPTVFFTVYYALQHLARLEKGERILIHAAAGGIGIAAIQYARHVGAEIFATAGSPEKRDLVRLLGVPKERILDSRSNAFADQILDATGGEGVDVVLNSLAGEAVHKSLAALRPFGKFIELGKRDFYADSKVGLRPFRNNLTYFGVDADQVIAERPDLARRLFREVVEMFARRAFAPLPLRQYPADAVVAAFRQMQAAKHVGKIVVTAPAPPSPVVAAVAAPGIDSDAAYLVTGGTGGFGLACARWLAEQGARHLALVSRRGADAPGWAAIAAEFAAAGVSASAYACDVADDAAVVRLVDTISAERPLKGVIHAAAVFADTAAAAMTPELLAASLGPKAGGAWALDRATRGHALDHFVVFSSVTTLFGNPGQANYVAANLFLERLVVARRDAGLPGLAVCWGPIADAGYLTRATDTAVVLESRLGAASMTSSAAFVWLGRLMADPTAPTVAVADLDWRALRGLLPALKKPRFAAVAGGGESDGEAAQDLAQRLATVGPEEALKLISAALAEAVGHVLRLPTESLDHHKPIYDFGMDSLMALELRMAIEENIGVQLTAMAISPDATIARLAERIRDQIAGVVMADEGDTARVFAAHAETVTGLNTFVEAAEAEVGAGVRLLS